MTAASPVRRSRRESFPDPVYWVWRKLTSVRFALWLIAIVALFALAGVIIPQVPPQLAGEQLAVGQFVDDQRGTWGPFTDPLAEFPWFYDANGGVFNLFNQPYWYALVALLALSITVCTVSRFPPIYRFVRRPQRRVNDRYFERARHRLDFAAPPGAEAVEEVLRRHHYRVQVDTRDGARYLFADRFGWVQFATFISHTALLLLVLGTLLTKFGGEEFQFWVGEGQSRPLFATGGDRQQMLIIVDDAIARFNDAGQALDFRSAVRVTRGGEEIAAGEVTVNGPLKAGGFRVHQAAYWEHGAELQVRDTGSGQLLYSEILFLDQQFFGPRVRITNLDSGAIVAEEVIQLSQAVADVPESGYQVIPLGEETSLALVLVSGPGGESQFYYSRLALAAEAGASLDAPALSAADLRLFEAPPLAPRLRLYDAETGRLLVEDVVTLSDGSLDGRVSARVGFIPLTETETLAVGFEEAEGGARFFYFNTREASQRGVLETGQRAALGAFELEYVQAEPDRGLQGSLPPGESQQIGSIELTYLGSEPVHFAIEEGIPGAHDESLLLLERFGQGRIASTFDARKGEDVELERATTTVSTTTGSTGSAAALPARLGIGLGDSMPRLDLSEGETAILGDYEYVFVGTREFTGLTVRRDPGAIVFWIAIILGLVGLALTFFVPRRRIWARITPERVYLAGLAGHAVNLRKELARYAAEAGAPDADTLDDDDWGGE